jgi:hypothetical protein
MNLEPPIGRNQLHSRLRELLDAGFRMWMGFLYIALIIYVVFGLAFGIVSPGDSGLLRVVLVWIPIWVVLRLQQQKIRRLTVENDRLSTELKAVKPPAWLQSRSTGRIVPPVTGTGTKSRS